MIFVQLKPSNIKKMKKTFLFLLLIFSTSTFAQNKKLSMQDAVIGLWTNLRVNNLEQVQWIPNTDSYSEVITIDDQKVWVRRNLPEFATDTLAFAEDFENNKIPRLTWLDENTAFYKSGVNVMFWKADENSSKKYWSLDSTAEDDRFEPRTKALAYVLDNDIFLYDGDQLHQVTSDGSYEIVNGKAVHREEFGIDRGIFFSGEGNYLAFYRMDQSMVEDYPIIDWSTVPATNKFIKYPFAGRTSHQVTLGIYNIKTKETIFVQTGEPKDQFLTNISWSPDEKSIYIAVLNREQNHMQLNEYDVSSGKFLRTLFEEKHDKYVEPQHPMYFLPNGKEFVWHSQRDGYMHLYRYNKRGKLLNQITKGHWLVNEIVGMNEKENQLLITATKDGAKERHLYKVNWKNGEIERIDANPGVHQPMVNTAGTYIIDNWSNETSPRQIDLWSTDKTLFKTLLKAENPLVDYQMPTVENITLQTEDGIDLYGKLIYPIDFNPEKKYPVIVYLYNGPHLQLNTNRFPASGNLWYDYMAQNGYLVWVMDGRGSANRGLAFEQAIYRQLGTVEMQDHLVGIDYLKSLDFVDSNRMGIHGWSYGGFMATTFMLHQPDVFKAGVAGGPVLDWSMYEIMYGERYMDTPQTNAEGYAKSLLLDKTSQLKGKLLIIHGGQDDVVLLQHSMEFLKNAVDEGVQIDFFLYPNHAHNVLGMNRVHLMQKVTDYFDQYLKNSEK